MSFNVIRFERIKTQGHIKKAQGHNFRLHSNIKNVDEERSKNNVFLVGDEKTDLQFLFDALKEKYKFKYIKDEYVMYDEFVISASSDFLDVLNEKEKEQYFRDNLKILQDEFFKVEDSVVSAVIHKDELTYHLHIIACPLVATQKEIKRGKDKGKIIDKVVLSHDQILGTREKCRRLQDVFNEKLNEYGWNLERGRKNTGIKYKETQQFYKEMNQIREDSLKFPKNNIEELKEHNKKGFLYRLFNNNKFTEKSEKIINFFQRQRGKYKATRKENKELKQQNEYFKSRLEQQAESRQEIEKTVEKRVELKLKQSYISKAEFNNKLKQQQDEFNLKLKQQEEQHKQEIEQHKNTIAQQQEMLFNLDDVLNEVYELDENIVEEAKQNLMLKRLEEQQQEQKRKGFKYE